NCQSRRMHPLRRPAPVSSLRLGLLRGTMPSNQDGGQIRADAARTSDRRPWWAGCRLGDARELENQFPAENESEVRIGHSLQFRGADFVNLFPGQNAPRSSIGHTVSIIPRFGGGLPLPLFGTAVGRI